eukprot:scaffold81681_cov60-Phaeocystis_antarctica.AAC.2
MVRAAPRLATTDAWAPTLRESEEPTRESIATSVRRMSEVGRGALRGSGCPGEVSTPGHHL